MKVEQTLRHCDAAVSTVESRLGCENRPKSEIHLKNIFKVVRKKYYA